jgi:oligoendopeptidase F
VRDGDVTEGSLDEALARLSSADREERRAVAEAVTEALRPGLRTRGFIFNTLLNEKAIDDRLRSFPHWLAHRNLVNEASDESVQALVDAVRGRYGLAQRWYRLKAQLLGVDRLADYDRSAAVTERDEKVEWPVARDLVLEAYGAFSPDLERLARRFFDERWIDAPPRPAKRGGAFAHSTAPSAHPYVMLNYTARRRDVLVMAHELGHGVHQSLSAPQGILQAHTPLTVSETASVFGETMTFSLLLERAEDPESRLALLAESVEGSIATVFRQIAMHSFEDRVHTARREEGEVSIDRFCDLWAQTQEELFGDAVEVTEGYRSWWSYIPHFIGSPGYVYAYAYGQLLALSVYRRYEEEGATFVPDYLRMLSAGGSMSPEDLGRLVGVDLADPGFWDAGLDLVEGQLEDAEQAARDAGRLRS